MKRILTNSYGKAILSDLDAFKWEIKQEVQEADGGNTVFFRWSWHNYDGTGEIEYADGAVCNTVNHNFSTLSLSSACAAKHANIKHSCSLYNDKDLEQVFNHILDGILLIKKS